jgi:hypothetical protein
MLKGNRNPLRRYRKRLVHFDSLGRDVGFASTPEPWSIGNGEEEGVRTKQSPWRHSCRENSR